MEYVEQLKKEDLNVVSEFLVMAATLLDIKSRMLLPKEVDEEGNEEDPRAELVEKLLEYKMCIRDRNILGKRKCLLLNIPLNITTTLVSCGIYFIVKFIILLPNTISIRLAIIRIINIRA